MATLGGVFCPGSREQGESALRLTWADWLRSIRWDYWTTPTFRRDVTDAYARHAVTRWLGRQSPSVYAVVAYERGQVGGRTHVHALVGGIGRHPLGQTHLCGSWRHGNILVEPYHPRLDRSGARGGACWYISPEWDALDLVGSLNPWRPRKRGGKGSLTGLPVQSQGSGTEHEGLS